MTDFVNWHSGPSPVFDATADVQLEQWLARHLGQEIFNPGLERMRAIADLLPRRESCKATVIIAGTNGKGQTSHELSYILSMAGASWCLWTSPHVLSVTERFKSSEGHLSRQELKNYFERLDAIVRKVKIPLSYYEFLFACFLIWVAEKKPEYLILEVGLGGRLDAVNIFNAQLVLLPSISRDHTSILGNSLKTILHEKLGVTRRGAYLFHTLEQAYLRRETELFASHNGVVLMDLWPSGEGEDALLWRRSYVERNRMLALRAAFFLLGKIPAIKHWPTTRGRLDCWGFSGGEIWFSGSHNLDGHRKFISHTIEGNHNVESIFDSVLLSFSDRPIREVEAILELYLSTKGFCREVVVAPFEHPKAMALQQYYDTWQRRWPEKLHCHKQWIVAVDEWRNEKAEHNCRRKVLVSGSYYFVGHLQRHLLLHHPSMFSFAGR